LTHDGKTAAARPTHVRRCVTNEYSTNTHPLIVEGTPTVRCPKAASSFATALGDTNKKLKRRGGSSPPRQKERKARLWE
jgi:hypothetical protein